METSTCSAVDSEVENSHSLGILIEWKQFPQLELHPKFGSIPTRWGY